MFSRRIVKNYFCNSTNYWSYILANKIIIIVCFFFVLTGLLSTFRFRLNSNCADLRIGCHFVC